MVAIPRDLYLILRKEGLKQADVVEYRLGGRFPRQDMKGRACWVRPVSVLMRDGKKYTFELVDLNLEGE